MRDQTSGKSTSGATGGDPAGLQQDEHLERGMQKPKTFIFQTAYLLCFEVPPEELLHTVVGLGEGAKGSRLTAVVKTKGWGSKGKFDLSCINLEISYSLVTGVFS